MEEPRNLGQLKRELQALALSTSTPGLTGEERYEELLKRLQNNQPPGAIKQSHPSDNESTYNKSSTSARGNYNDLKHLNLTELRSRLTALGQNTNTPGLTGEERWNALLQRLVDTICGEENEITGVSPKQTSPKVEEVSHRRNRLPPTQSPRVPGVITKQQSPVISVIPPVIEEETEAVDYRSDINEMKKLLKKLLNKRSIAIASQLSGDNQDAQLKRDTNTLNIIEADILRCQAIEQRGESRIGIEELKSSIIKARSNIASVVDIPSTLATLFTARDDIKEKIRIRRGEIRQAAEEHADYGTAVEERLKSQLSQISLAQNSLTATASVPVINSSSSSNNNTTSNNNSNSSRVRRKLFESQSMDQQVTSDTATTAAAAVEEVEEVEEVATATVDLELLAKRKQYQEYLLTGQFPSKSSSRVNTVRQAENSKNSDIEEVISSSTNRTDEELQMETARISARISARILEVRKSFTSLSPPKEDNNDMATLSTSNSSAASSPQKPSPLQSQKQHQQQQQHIQQAKHQFSVLPTHTEQHPKKQTAAAAAAAAAADNKEEREGGDDEEGEGPAIIELLQQARELQRQDDILAAEILLDRALELQPTSLNVLTAFAIFLHGKKGELARAEAFFHRALQLCMPALSSQLQQMTASASSSTGLSVAHLLRSNPLLDKRPPPPSQPQLQHELQAKELPVPDQDQDQRLTVKQIIRLLITFASFLAKAKGDVDAAAVLWQRAVTLGLQHADALAGYAHFLSQYVNLKSLQQEIKRQKENESGKSSKSSGGDKKEEAQDKEKLDRKKKRDEQLLAMRNHIEDLYRRALRAAPGNVHHLQWFANFLKKNNNLAAAELLYQSAAQLAAQRRQDNDNDEDDDEEATAVCNYAAFLSRYRRQSSKAITMCEEVLKRYPDHAGIRRNLVQMKKQLEKEQMRAKDDQGDKREEVEQNDESEEDGVDNDKEKELEVENKDTAAFQEADVKRMSPPLTLQLQAIVEEEDSNQVHQHVPVKSPYYLSSVNLLPPSSSQSRGSRRAQRMQQSIALQIPADRTTPEQKASFILDRVRRSAGGDGRVGSSSNSSNNSGLIKSDQQQASTVTQHDSSSAMAGGWGSFMLGSPLKIKDVIDVEEQGEDENVSEDESSKKKHRQSLGRPPRHAHSQHDDFEQDDNEDGEDAGLSYEQLVQSALARKVIIKGSPAIVPRLNFTPTSSAQQLLSKPSSMHQLPPPAASAGKGLAPLALPPWMESSMFARDSPMAVEDAEIDQKRILQIRPSTSAMKGEL